MYNGCISDMADRSYGGFDTPDGALNTFAGGNREEDGGSHRRIGATADAFAWYQTAGSGGHPIVL